MSVTFPGAASVGRVIAGRFPLLEKLGETRWSSAWLTEFEDGWAQRAAIKIFPFDLVDAPATVARWDIARTLSHPHLMPLFEAGRCDNDDEDLLYVVTECADESLSQILPERPLTREEARAMLGPVLGALSHLHKLGLTHGHLRPTNVMGIEDQLKLSPDFSWCSLRHSIYDAPEAGSEDAAPAADIWSLGILLVESLTQRAPAWDKWQGGDPEIPAIIPEPFFTICRRCLRIDPERRCTLDQIWDLLHPRPLELAFETANPRIDRTMKPLYGFRAMIFISAVLFLMLMIGAFKLGWELTPSTPWPSLHGPFAVQAAAPEPAAAGEPATIAEKIPEPAPAPAPPAAAEAVPAWAGAPARSPAQAAPARHTAATGPPARAPAPAAHPAEAAEIKGSVVHQVMPEIPASILATIQGHVRVAIRVGVSRQGNVAQASIDSPGPSRYFASQALHAAQKWKFAPARVAGRPEPSLWLLEFQFGQTQTVVTPTEESP